MTLYRAIEIDPENANAHNSLGYIYAESNLNLDEALKECRKAVQLDRNNPAYLDSLGWVYYKLGDLQQAKTYLKKAARLAPDNREIEDHYEAVLSNLGRS
jgi:Flp pilus assembly protein TadD